MAPPMPALFFGHGNPMNAVSRNAYTEAWAGLGAELPRPKAVLMVSAHWYGSRPCRYSQRHAQDHS